MINAPPKELMKLITPPFRGSYCNLVKARAFEEGDEPQFNMMVVLKKGTPDTKKFLAQLEAAVTECCIAKFGKDMLPHSSLKHWPVQDGDLGDNEEHAGCWTFRAGSKFRPGAIEHGTKRALFEENELYSGAWYRASISVWGWNNPKYGKGVSFNLHNVMKIRDDEKFGGGAKPEEDFADHLDEAGADAASEMGLD